MAPIEAITEEHFRRHFNINVLGLLLATQAAVKYLGEGGSIRKISNQIKLVEPEARSFYGSLDRRLRRRTAPFGIGDAMKAA